jgi:hypothetical protein
MPKSVPVTLLAVLVLLSIGGTLAGNGSGENGDKHAVGIAGRPSVQPDGKPSAHLLDRGTRRRAAALKGGGPPGPIPIAYPGAGPTAMAAGFAGGVGAFGTGTSSGAFAGNLFVPGLDYPPDFLTGGTMAGFDVTGVYAWHSPFLKTGMFSAVPAGSTRRILAAAAVAIPTAPLASAAVGPAGFELVTVSTGLAGPTAIVGGPGNLASPMPILPGGFPAVFCGLAIGGPGFIDTGWLGNGVGAIIPPPGPMPPPTRLGFPPAFFGTTMGMPFPIAAIAFTATPQIQIAGCFAAGATTPVELQAFHVD